MSPVGVSSSRAKRSLGTGKPKLLILSIGVNHYQDERLPSLRYSALDCQALAEALQETTGSFSEKQVIAHHDFVLETPQRQTVFSSLEKIVKQARSHDTLLFYFSGHGVVDKETQQAVLCLADTDKDNLLETGLKLEELLHLFDNCAAHQQLVLLDACHSGGMTLRLNPTPELVKVLQQQAQKSKGFYALLSCDREQQSWEFPELGHGVFTYYLIRGLRGEAADAEGAIAVDGLYRYVYHQTLQYIDKTNQQLRLINQQKRDRGGTQLHPEYPLQTPKRIVEGVGEIILGTKQAGIESKYPRQALVVEGLTHPETSLALSRVLRRAGKFDLQYFPQPGKAWLDVREAIQQCFDNIQDATTILLYLRGRIEDTPDGEAWLILGEEFKLSRSWLRQVLRQNKQVQQIIVLDCPGATSLSDWIEDLQLGQERGQCLIAGASPERERDRFAKALLTTLENANKPIGLPVAGWIAQLQVELADTGIGLQVWLSGAQGIIEVIPGGIGTRNREATEAFDLGVCPYVGLRAFSEADAQYFYGRESLTQKLIHQLGQQTFLAVVGASGSGKSSVVQAGLVAQLREGKQLPGSETWWIKCFRPGVEPIKALAQRLAEGKTESERIQQQLQLEGLLHLGVEGLVQWLRSRPEPVVVLVVDQFEELFTLAGSKEREDVLEMLFGAIAYAGDRFKIVITLRADFIATCLEVPTLATVLQQSSVFVPPALIEDDYRRVILHPAEQVGLNVEPQLLEVLCQELHHSSSTLPLLQFVLEQLWEHRSNGQLTLKAYQQQIGGVKGALERKAQAVYQSLDVEAQACAKWIFLALTQLGEGTEDTRRRILKSELVVQKYPTPLVERTLQALTAAKLVVVNLDNEEAEVATSRSLEGATPEELTLEALKQEVTVEVVHEVLIRHWSTLRWWLEENRARLRVQRQIEQAAKLWHQRDYQPDFLLQGVRLAEAEELYIKYTDELSQDVQAFIEAGLTQRQQQQQQAKRRLRQAQAAVTIIGALGFTAFGLGGFSYWQAQQVRVSQIEALNSLSEALLASNKQLEALVATVKAGQQLKTLSSFAVSTQLRSSTENILRQVVQRVRERNRLEGHGASISSLSFSPDGRWVATGSIDNTIKLWRRDGREFKTLTGHRDSVTGISFSPDGQTLVSGSLDNTIKVWNLEGKELQTLQGHQGWVTSVSFSPDGQTLASGSADKTVKLWNLQGREVKTFRGHQGWVTSISFSPDGQTLASGSEDKTVRLWNLQGREVKTFRGHSDRITDISFNFNGEVLASASSDKTVKIWQIQQPANVAPITLKGHDNWVTSVSFSPDGQTLATGSEDKTVKLWSLAGEELETLQGHSAAVTEIQFSPEGEVLASASADKSIKFWNVGGIHLNAALQGHTEPVMAVSFSPDAQMLASASLDYTIKLWHRDGKVISTLKGHSSWVTDVAFSPDGQMLTSASQDKTIKLWNLQGKELQSLQGHQQPVNRVRFSPDGTLLASASDDKTIKLWNIQGQELQTLQGHQEAVYGISFSPDGTRIASGSADKTIKLWSREGKLLKTLSGHHEAVWNVAFSPDSQQIASGSDDKTIKLWSSEGELLQTLNGHQGWVWNLSFHPNGEILASGSDDKTVKLWSIKSYRELQTLRGHQAGVLGVAWSSDGTMLASAGFDKTVRLWTYDNTRSQTLTLNELLAQSCTWLDDYLNNNRLVDLRDRSLCQP